MKNLFVRASLVTAVLGVVIAALAVLILVRLATGTKSDELLATPPKALRLPEMKLDATPLQAQLEPLRDRVLFYASRSFYIAPPAQAPTTPPQPKYVLAGTFVIPHKHTVALLKQSSGTSVVKVKAGDDLEGWRIESVESARVVLSYHDDRFEIARAARESGNHVTRAPLQRRGTKVVTASTATSTPVDATNPSVSTTVKSLGSGGRSGASLHDAALRPGQSSMEPRLYRPPPQ